MTQALWEIEKVWPQCKIHNLDLIYSRYWNKWACQSKDCPFAHGINLWEMDVYPLGN